MIASNQRFAAGATEDLVTAEELFALWQVEIARETQQGHGIDALHRILLAVRNRFAGDEIGLLAAIDEMRDCADRHLMEHNYETVEAIFRAVFPSLNNELDATKKFSASLRCR
jgi:hypothetical protein